MFRAFHPARSKNHKGLTSRLALAFALTAGAAVGVAGLAEPAYAQSKPAKPKYSKGFVTAYEPVEEVFKAVPDGGDFSAIKGQLPAIVTAVETEDDRYAVGQLILQVGNKSTDPVLQRQGLEMMLASGKVAPEQIGQFQYFVGNLAYQAKDFEAARKGLLAALAAGYTDNEAAGLVAESYFQQDDFAGGLNYLKQVVDERVAAGQKVPDTWLLRGLQVAYNNKMSAEANDMAMLLVQADPTPKNWLAALQVVREVNPWGTEEIVDLGRLMMATGSMQKDYDLAEYVEAVDPRKLSNEVLTALDKATAAGVIPPDSQRFAEFRQIAEDRAAADRNEAPGLKSEAQAAATGTVALGVADTFLSFGSNAEAEAMYQLAIDKGAVDVNRALTRKGIAQLRQGKVAEAKATFEQVQGPRASLAHLWAIHADTQASAASGG